MSLGFICAIALPSAAAVFTVTTTADSGEGSLRSCINQANKTAEKDRILFDIPSDQTENGTWTIGLTSPLPAITAPLRIVGPGPTEGALIIARESQQAFRLFSFRPATGGTELYLSLVTLAKGSDTEGGAIALRKGKLTLERCRIATSNATGAGGAILKSAGALTANACTFDLNFARQGGAIAASGTGGVTLTNCRFLRNTGYVPNDHESRGGAIDVAGTLTATNCLFSQNTSPNGGALFSQEAASGESSEVTLDLCRFDGNSTKMPDTAGNGGAIQSHETSLSIQRSSFIGNSSFGGGAIYSTGETRIGRTLFSKNLGGNGSVVNVSRGRLDLVNCTLAENDKKAVGCIYVGQSSDNSGATVQGAVTLTNCTLFHNGSAGYGEAVVTAGTLKTINSLFRPLEGGVVFYPHVSGTVISLGHNLSSDDGSGFLTAEGDQINVKPLLDVLKDNGGPSLTMALLPGSPAINKGDDVVLGSSYGLGTDQRGAGFARKSGERVDIGAFEVQGASAADKPSLKTF